MKINKKILRDILVRDFVDNGTDWLRKESGSHFPIMVEAIHRGRADKNLLPYWSSYLRRGCSVHLESKGFRVESDVRCSYKFPKDGSVKIKLFSVGNKSMWILIPKDTAEKILVLGMVPNFT